MALSCDKKPIFRFRNFTTARCALQAMLRSGAATTSTANLGAAAAAEAIQLAGLAPGLDKMATRPTCGARNIAVRRQDDADDALRSGPEHAGAFGEMVLAQGLGE